MKYVVDASVIAKLFLPIEQGSLVADLFAQAYANDVQLIAPPLLLFEVNNALVKSSMSADDRNASLDELFGLIEDGALTIRPYSSALLKKAGEIADLETGGGYVSSYDASYHALAVIEDAVFLTDDQAHIRKTKDAIGAVVALNDLGK